MTRKICLFLFNNLALLANIDTIKELPDILLLHVTFLHITYKHVVIIFLHLCLESISVLMKNGFTIYLQIPSSNTHLNTHVLSEVPSKCEGNKQTI